MGQKKLSNSWILTELRLTFLLFLCLYFLKISPQSLFKITVWEVIAWQNVWPDRQIVRQTDRQISGFFLLSRLFSISPKQKTWLVQFCDTYELKKLTQYGTNRLASWQVCFNVYQTLQNCNCIKLFHPFFMQNLQSHRSLSPKMPISCLLWLAVNRYFYGKWTNQEERLLVNRLVQFKAAGRI